MCIYNVIYNDYIEFSKNSTRPNDFPCQRCLAVIDKYVHRCGDTNFCTACRETQTSELICKYCCSEYSLDNPDDIDFHSNCIYNTHNNEIEQTDDVKLTEGKFKKMIYEIDSRHRDDLARKDEEIRKLHQEMEKQ